MNPSRDIEMISGEMKSSGASSDRNRSPNVVWIRTGPSKHKNQINCYQILNLLQYIKTHTYRPRNHQSQFRTDHHRRDGLFVSGKRCSRRWYLSLSDNTLRSSVPVPQQYCAIGRTGSDVTVRSDVALGPCQTRDNTKMTENNLHDFRRFCGKDSETVVPEAASQQESTVDGGDKAIRTNAQLLTEVVAEMTTHSGYLIVVGIRLNCKNLE